MFGRKRIAELEGKLADLQQGHDALYERYTGVNQEIGELRAWIKGIETRVGGLEDLYGGVAKSHVKEIKRVSDLQERLKQPLESVVKFDSQELISVLEPIKAAVQDVLERFLVLEEAQRQAGRKKVRRRDPETGRFVWDYSDELGEQHNVSAAAADGITQKPGGPDR